MSIQNHIGDGANIRGEVLQADVVENVTFGSGNVPSAADDGGLKHPHSAAVGKLWELLSEEGAPRVGLSRGEAEAVTTLLTICADYVPAVAACADELASRIRPT
ncbi:hypothetical protein ACFU99_01675 [Streptomyces sp. NPDC057654]|uniref:hypothetical protein n=1 Tax=Streptomyces sp. NPDC057654 TaxID=3346196 RepID=UPI0036CC6C14